MKTTKCPTCRQVIRQKKPKKLLNPSQMRKLAGLPCEPSNEKVTNLMEELEA